MNMIDEHRSVQKDGTLDLRGIINIKDEEYRNNYSIKKVIIGSSVQTIGAWAFIACQNVEEIIFKEPYQIKILKHSCFGS